MIRESIVEDRYMGLDVMDLTNREVLEKELDAQCQYQERHSEYEDEFVKHCFVSFRHTVRFNIEAIKAVLRMMPEEWLDSQVDEKLNFVIRSWTHLERLEPVIHDLWEKHIKWIQEEQRKHLATADVTKLVYLLYADTMEEESLEERSERSRTEAIRQGLL